MGWASGFTAGTNMARSWIDTYEKAKQWEIEDQQGALKRKAGLEADTISAKDAARLRAMSEETVIDPNTGKAVPRYQLTIEPGTTDYKYRELAYPQQERVQREPTAPAGLHSNAQTYGNPAYVDSGTVYQRPDEEAETTPPWGPGVNAGIRYEPPAAKYLQNEGVITDQRTAALLAAAQAEDARLATGDAMGVGYARPTGADGTIGISKTSFLGKEYDLGTLTPGMRQAALMEGYADIYERAGKPLEALRMRQMVAQERRAEAAEGRAVSAEGRAAELHGPAKRLVTTQAEAAEDALSRQTEFRNGLTEDMKIEDPDKRQEAIFNRYMKFEPLQAAQLKASLTEGQLKDITLQAKKFEQGFSQAFTKGETAVIKWLDEQNPGFKLELRGNQIVQTNEDGSQRVFAQGTAEQRMEQMAAQASPDNFLKLAQINATRDYHKAVLAAKTSTARINPAQKEYVDYLERESMAQQKLLAQTDPSDPNYGRIKADATRARFNYFQSIRGIGVDVDPYSAVGAPSPAEFARQIQGMSAAEADKRINAAVQMFGPEYVGEARKAIGGGGLGPAPGNTAPKASPSLNQGGGNETYKAGQPITSSKDRVKQISNAESKSTREKAIAERIRKEGGTQGLTKEELDIYNGSMK